jgi:hypothetical protein
VVQEGWNDWTIERRTIFACRLLQRPERERVLCTSSASYTVSISSLYARHSQKTSDGRDATRNKVDGIDDAESDKEAGELLEPSVKVRSRHEQHPPTQACNAKSNSNAQAQLAGDMNIALVVLSLNSSSLDSTVIHANSAIFAQTAVPENVGQNLEPEHGRAEDEDKDVTTDVMATSPRTTGDLAGSVSEDFSGIAHLVLLVVVDGVVGVDDLALAAGQSKAAVDDGWAEEPLGDCAPDGCHSGIADDGANTASGEGRLEARTQGAVGEAEEEEGASDPDPADLDKVDVEDIGLESKVRGCDGRRVGLEVAAVRRVARLAVQNAEQGSQHQREGVDGQQDALEEGGIPR